MDGFRAKLVAGVKKATAGVSPTVPVGLDINRDELGRFLSTLQQNANIQVNAETEDAVAKIIDLRERLEALSGVAADIPIDANDAKALATMAGLQLKMAAFARTLTNLQLNVDDTAAVAKLTGLQAQESRLAASMEKMTSDVDIAAAEAKLAYLRAQIALLQSQMEDMKLGISAAGLLSAEAQLLGMTAAVNGINKAMADAAKADQDKSAADAAAAASANLLVGAWSRLPPELRAVSAAQKDAENSANGLWGIWGFLNTRVSLFGGLLGKFAPGLVTWVHSWHLMAEGIIETLAVWGPATIAIGVFAAAASQGVQNITTHMENMLNVVNSTAGTATKLDPLTGGFLKMQNAVQPAVYELWGDAITVAGHSSGILLNLVTQLVPVIEQLGARTTAAIDSGGMQVFMKNAVGDVAQLGTAFGNFFGLIGNLMKAVPGYAKYLLDFGTGFLGVAEHVTAAITPILYWGLALHGIVLYTGLAVTIGLRFGTMLAGWGSAIVGAVASVGTFIAEFAALAAEEGIVTAATIVLKGALASITTVGWIGILVGATAALITLVIWMKDSQTATQAWGAALQTSIKGATDLSTGLSLLTSGQAQASAKLSAATTQLGKTQEFVTGTGTKFGSSIKTVSAAYTEQASKVQQLQVIQSQLGSETQTYNARVGDLAKTYGGTSAAQALLTASGVTMTQMLDKSGSAWAQIQIEVEGANNGLKSMATTSGIYGNELQALDRQTTTSSGASVSAIQKVTQAMDALVSGTTATQSSFDTYAQGLSTLSSNSATFTNHLGSLEVKGTQTKAAIDSLSVAGVNLNQAFTQQVTNTNALIDTWRTAGVTTNLFTQGVAASIAPLEKYAKGSSEATAQLVALGETAGYQGPNNLADLNKFLGITSSQLKNTAGETQKVKDITDQATVQEALLTSAMQNQGSYISGTLLGDINSAILKYGGVANAVSAYGQALAQYGKGSSQANAAMKTAVDDLVKSELAMGDSTSQMGAVVAKVFGVSMPAAMKLVKAALEDTAVTSAKTGIQMQINFNAQATAASNASKGLTAYTKAIQDNGADSSQAKSARQQLVNDLIAAGVNSKTAETDVSNYTKSLADNGTETTAGKAARQQLLNDLLSAHVNSDAANKAVTDYTKAVATNGIDSDQAKAARQQLITDLKDAGVGSKQANTDVDAYNKIILDNGNESNATRAARQQLITDILNASKNARQGKIDLANFTTTVHDNGTTTDAYKSARARLLQDLKNAGINAHTAQGLVDGFSKSITQIPGGKQIGINVTGTGTWSISQGESLQKALIAGTKFGAAGMLVSGGTPNKDSVPIMAMPGETVVPKHLTPVIAPLMAAHNVPGFAMGGIVGGGAGGALSSDITQLGNWTSTQYQNTAAAMTQSVGDAMTNAIKAAQAAAAKSSVGNINGAGVSNSSAEAALQSAAAKMGWTGAQWQALYDVEMREAGFNTAAQNASSGAYGLAQFINGQSEYASYGGNSGSAAGQAVGMVNYIKQRYGNPEAAWAHELCVPLSVQILTRRGWLTHDQLRAGDETVGYDTGTGRSAWTPVTAVHVYEDAPLVRLSNKTWEATCTPHHRWVAAHLRHAGRKGHQGRTKNEYVREDVFVEAQSITSRHTLRVAAPADVGDGLAISQQEAELLGWVLGDGWVIRPKSRTPGSTHWRALRGTQRSVRLGQAKPEHVKAIDALVAGLLFSRTVRQTRKPGGGAALPLVTWEFHRPYSEELLKRSGYDHQNPVPFVLSLDEAQREAFLRGVFGAEGSLHGDGTFKGASGYPRAKVYPQADGPKQDAITLAIFLSGKRPGISAWNRPRVNNLGCENPRNGASIRETKPFIGGERIEREDAGRGAVYCVTTGLGSWTMRQGRQVMLTGNSYGWYDNPLGSIMPKGLSLAYNGTGAPEPLVPATPASKQDASLSDVVRALAVMQAQLKTLNTTTSQQGAAFGQSLGASARAGSNAGYYSGGR